MQQFKPNGTFRIMQITDTQEDPNVSPDTVRLIDAALDKAKPDLVVFTGDQIKGYSTKFRGKDAKTKVKGALDAITGPVRSRGIPFAVTFGNHDKQALPEEEQMAIYRESPLCINPAEEIAGSHGTFHIPIFSSTGEKVAFNLYLIHSGGDAKGGGYENVNEEKIRWYQATREQLKEQVGAYVPSLVFQHIPVDEYYQILKRADKKTKGAVRAYRTHKDEYYVLPDELLANGHFLGERPASPDVNSGEFEALAEKGEVLGMWVGHDHINSFAGNHKGIDLGYTQGAGFNVYGPGVNRGVRVFDLDETKPNTYKTHTLTFQALVGKKVKKPLKNYLYSHVPTTVDAAIPLIIKTLLALAAIIAAIVVLVKIL
ncbi:MAG: metallophosphoesterase family protein [Oscillospiraceae bacterium]|nr:metallophosphoesterase family protein [Oscillospiraceae bacterium]